MKKNLLKAREIYAVRNMYEPCLLLDTAVHHEHSRARGATSYTPAADHKPGRDPSRRNFGFDRHDYGFLMLRGSLDELKALDPLAAYRSLLETGRLPENMEVQVEVVTSLAAILDRHEDYQAAERKRREAEQARHDRARERRLALVARHNAVVGRLNRALGEELIARAKDDGYSEPVHVTVALAQAEALADLLDAITLNPKDGN